jgi:hypothetical protein
MAASRSQKAHHPIGQPGAGDCLCEGQNHPVGPRCSSKLGPTNTVAKVGAARQMHQSVDQSPIAAAWGQLGNFYRCKAGPLMHWWWSV